MYLLNYEMFSYHAAGALINEEMDGTAKDIFRAVIKYVQQKNQGDLEPVYIAGSKFGANTNKQNLELISIKRTAT